MSRHSRPIRSAKEILARKLQPEEEILWEGRPVERRWTWTVAKRTFQGCFLLFILLWGIRLIWLCSGFVFLFAMLAFLPVAYILLVFTIDLLSAPWLERSRRRDSLYALTNRRLIAITKPNTLFIRKMVRTYPLCKLKHVRFKQRRNGTGNVILGYGRRSSFTIRDVPRLEELVGLLREKLRQPPDITPPRHSPASGQIPGASSVSPARAAEWLPRSAPR